MKRNADQTRTRLLEAAFAEMHRRGYQGMRVSAVLEKAGLQKGAFYHHFHSKRELGLAVLNERVAAAIQERWTQALAEQRDPISAIIRTIRNAGDCIAPDEMFLGCPLNNLAQEMSPIDDAFRTQINGLMEAWQGAIAAALEKGKAAGTVAAHVDARRTAVFFLAALEGCLGRAKASRNLDELEDCARSLIDYLQRLRPSADALGVGQKAGEDS